MIEVKEAVRIARDYLEEMYQNDAKDVLLEETVLSEDGKHWFITLSYDATPMSILEALRKSMPPTEWGGYEEYRARRGLRQYKIIKIDSDSGQVQSMKIRNPFSQDEPIS